MLEESDQRYTPESVLSVVRALAPIGLDPCTIASNPTGARFFYTADTNGLHQSWACCPSDELAWVNPPYSRGELMRWAGRVVEASRMAESELLMLTPCDLGTQWATHLFLHAQAVGGWRGRIAFTRPDGSYDTGAKQPSLVWYFGERQGRFQRVFGDVANVTILGVRS